MKQILKVLCILICVFSFGIVSAETLISSDKVTYSNPKTRNENVKGALDELIEKVDSINVGGNALASDIEFGKTAYVQGKLITGTKVNKPVYSVKKSIPGKSVDFMNGVFSVDDKQGIIASFTLEGATQTAVVRAYKETEYQELYGVFKISEDVVIVYWGYNTDTIDTDTETKTAYYEYVTTYIVSAGKLTKVAGVCTSGGGCDGTNYAAYVYDYSKSTDTESRDRSTQHFMERSPIDGVDRVNAYFITGGSFSDSYTNYDSDVKDYENNGYYARGLQINKYTGACTQATANYGNSKYTWSATPGYDSVYEYDVTKLGLVRFQYNNTDHDTLLKRTYYDFYGSNGSTLTSSDPTDNTMDLRGYSTLYRPDSAFLLDKKISVDGLNVTIDINSVKLADNTSANPIVLLTNAKRTAGVSVNVSDVLPPNTTIVKNSFSCNIDGPRNTMNCSFDTSTKGKLYITGHLTSVNWGKGTGVEPVITGISYKPSGSTGALISSDDNFDYYR